MFIYSHLPKNDIILISGDREIIQLFENRKSTIWHQVARDKGMKDKNQQNPYSGKI